MIKVPLKMLTGHENSELILSISGGKDSTALLLLCLESQLKVRCVFADTGWENPLTYEYLDYLQLKTGVQIHRVGVEGGMLAKIRARAGFPARLQRWCTRELKVRPIKKYHEEIAEREQAETISLVGIRSDESQSRAKMAEFELCESWGGYVWRPMLNWTIDDVLQQHNKHNIKVNPLYQQGFSRVGCFPCIFAKKREIALIARNYPERIDEIEQLEEEMTVLRKELNAESQKKTGEKRYAWEQATFFQTKESAKKWMGIREIAAWSQTERGGKQLPLIQEPIDGGCYRWGLCDLGGGTDD